MNLVLNISFLLFGPKEILVKIDLLYPLLVVQGSTIGRGDLLNESEKTEVLCQAGVAQ